MMTTEEYDSLMNAKDKVIGLSIMLSALFEGGALLGRQKDDLACTGQTLQAVIEAIMTDLDAAGAVHEDDNGLIIM